MSKQERPKFSAGWCIFWLFAFFPACFIQWMMYRSKVTEYELSLMERKTKSR